MLSPDCLFHTLCLLSSHATARLDAGKEQTQKHPSTQRFAASLWPASWARVRGRDRSRGSLGRLSTPSQLLGAAQLRWAPEQLQQMSMYIRVKRLKTTVFLQVEPTDTVLEVKQKLQALLDKPPEKLQLWRLGPEGSADDKAEELADAQKLADARVENEDVLALCYAQEDGKGFEAINITPYDAEAPPS